MALDNNIKLPNINPMDYPTVKCSCGNEIYTPAVIFKDIPGVAVGSTENIQFPIKVFICSKCGELSAYDKELLNETNKVKSKNSDIIL